MRRCPLGNARSITVHEEQVTLKRLLKRIDRRCVRPIDRYQDRLGCLMHLCAELVLICLTDADLAESVAFSSIANALGRLRAGRSGGCGADSFGRALPDAPRVAVELVRMPDVIDMPMDHI